MEIEERNSLIYIYFYTGLEYKQIVQSLDLYHNIIISEKHLKRILKSLSLSRRKGYSDVQSVINFVESQLKESGGQHGYRWMTEKCKLAGLHCKQEEIRVIMRELDPEGAEQRKKHRLRRRTYISKGPDYIWHMDSYDKLKRFGFCINGCVDGFSKKPY